MLTLTTTDFVVARATPVLTWDEIHLWYFPRCSMAGTIRRGHERCLRDLLAGYLHVDPKTLQIERDIHGKPYLIQQQESASLQFNLSHTGSALLIGVARSQALGVDLETQRRSRPWLELAQRYFAGGETRLLGTMPAAQLGPAFLDLWSCKEAVLKALGRGIAFGLHRLDFDFTADHAVQHLVRIDVEAGLLEHWNVLRLRPEFQVLGALAWYGPPRNVRAFRVVE